MSSEANRRRLLSGVSLALLSAVFLTNPMTSILQRGGSASPSLIAARGFAAPLHMALLVGSVLGIMQLLRGKADRAGLTGGVLTILGWSVGIRILGLGQLESLLASGVTGVPGNVLERLFAGAPIVWTSIVPVGLLFPIGLLTLGSTLAFAAPIPRSAGVLLALGGLLFPVGRIGRLPLAYVGTDLLLGAALGGIAWFVLTRPKLWSAEV